MLSVTAKCGIIFMRFVLPYIKNSTPIYMSVEKMVEPRRIELLSEKATAELSPSAVRVLTFPLPSAHERAQGFSSFIMCSCGKA